MSISQDIAATIQLAANVTNTISPTRLAPCQVARLLTILEQMPGAVALDDAATNDPHIKAIHDTITRCSQSMKLALVPIAQKLPSSCQFFWPQQVEEMLKPDIDLLESQIETLRQIILTQQPDQSRTALLPPNLLSPATQRRFNKPGDFMLPASSDDHGIDSSFDLPTILRLQRKNGEAVLPPIRIQRIGVLERNEASRTILYESKRGSTPMTVAHRVPRQPNGIRYEDDDLDETSVAFLDSHEIVIHDTTGYKAYKVHAVYEFANRPSREQFLMKIRERILLGRYYARKIRKDNELLAQGKVVQMWLKTSSSLVTIAFLGRGGTQVEIDLGQCYRTAKRVKKTVTVVNTQDRKPPGTLTFDMLTNEEADRFRHAFEMHHPTSWDNASAKPPLTPSLLLSSSMGSSLRRMNTSSVSSVATSSAVSFMTTSTVNSAASVFTNATSLSVANSHKPFY